MKVSKARKSAVFLFTAIISPLENSSSTRLRDMHFLVLFWPLSLRLLFSFDMAPLPPIILKPYLSLQTLPALSSLHPLSLRLPFTAYLPLMTTKYLLWARVAFQIFKMKIVLLNISTSMVHRHLKHKMYKTHVIFPHIGVPPSASTCSAGISFFQRETLGWSETSLYSLPQN